MEPTPPFSRSNRDESFHFTFAQTSQDPSSPLATVATSSIPLQSTTSIAASTANRQSDIRDGWDNDEWGSLEEEPVRLLPKLFNLTSINLIFEFQNEEERDDNDETVSNAKSNENETPVNRSNTQKNSEHSARPNDLPNLITNHTTATSAMNLNSNSNAVWNSDSWAEGDFEPLDEPNSGIVALAAIALAKQTSIFQYFPFNRQAIRNWTRLGVSEKRRKSSDNVNWKRDVLQEAH